MTAVRNWCEEMRNKMGWAEIILWMTLETEDPKYGRFLMSGA